MAEIKWIKIVVDMFEDSKIEFIRSLPEGDSILVTWIQMMSIAGQSNMGGYLMITDELPYSEQFLASKLKRSPVFLQFALDTLCKLKMINIEDGPYHITNWEKYQNVEGMEKIKLQNKERKRLQREREKEKQLLSKMDLKRLEPPKIEYECAYCDGEGNTIDHIIPKSKGGLDIPGNCVPACKSCNSSKVNRDLSVFLNERLAKGVLNVDQILGNYKLMQYVIFNGKSFLSRDVTEIVTHDVTQCHATDIELDIDKELKHKTITKKREYADDVFLSEDEHGKLISKYGEQLTTKAIEILSLYKGSNGKKYKSDYKAMLNWVFDEANKRSTPIISANRTSIPNSPKEFVHDPDLIERIKAANGHV